MGLPPDVEFHSVQAIAPTLYPGNGYEWIHRKIDQADVYLISNQQEVPRQVEVVFRSNGRVPQLWNPDNGSIKQSPVYQFTQDGRTAVKLFMEPADSVFVVFQDQSDAASVVDVLHNGSTPFNEKADQPATLEIKQAVYGNLGGDASQQADVTAKLQSLVSDNSLQVAVDNKLAGRDPAAKTLKQLRVIYSLGDKQMTAVRNEKEMLKLGGKIEIAAAAPEPANLSVSSKGSVLTAWQPGEYELLYSDGKRQTVDVPSIPESVDLSQDWNLQCPKGWGSDAVKLDKLISWSEHSDPELKCFSGTAVYRKQFEVPADRLNDQYAVSLDFGAVKVIAEVILNGKNLGILWKPPFKLDVSGLLNSQNNQLEVRVTSLWINRLIGDAQYPSADVYEPGGKPGELMIKEIPAWLRNGEPRPETKQKTFVTCQFYSENSPLVESGLLGPVQLNFAVRNYLSRQTK